MIRILVPYDFSPSADHALDFAISLTHNYPKLEILVLHVIETPMTEATRSDPTRLAGFLKRTPAGRLGQADEVAAAIAFLASPLASFGSHACFWASVP